MSEDVECVDTPETFTGYVHQKITIQRIGTAPINTKPHPERLVQSSALNSVQPPEVELELGFLDSETKEIFLSNLSLPQLETIAYADNAFQEKLPTGETKGLYLGDGTGVGKGRQVNCKEIFCSCCIP